ncbi:extensin family protein [Novosphingobium lentum]|uniref:extensin family protein n=1 Tax=Novosphingobium lentum TaxID=145287 RepID=UPI00082BD36B|nr:extensin family protein [Novosphingobium lentum]
MPTPQSPSFRPALALVLVALLASCLGPSRPQPQHRNRAHTAAHANAHRGPQAIPRPTSAQGESCLADLRGAHDTFLRLDDRDYGNGCYRANAIDLRGVPGDDRLVMVSNLPVVSCSMARGFTGWTRFGAGRAALQILGSPLVRVETFGSYSCRNVAGSDRLSAHASANAIDVSGFALADGRRITVLGDWNNPDPAVRQFLRVVRASACKRFGTVLSPDYNAAHRDHLHVELGDGRFCH